MVDIIAARNKLTRSAIRRALYAVWPRPMGRGLINEALPDDLSCNGPTLERALYYLRDHGHIEVHGRADNGTTLHRLSLAGIARVETDPDFGAERAQALRMLRLRVLQALDLGQPQPMGLGLIGVALTEDADLDLSELSLRRALAYLVGYELAAQAGDSAWRITALGMDYLSGEGAEVSGVARPLVW